MPSVIRDSVIRQYALEFIGQTDELSQTFYAITVEKKVSNVVTAAVIQTANRVLFS